ncbi:MAG: enoyl-CoA hydratase [Alphaproteobacteria bacterium]
MTTAEKVLSQTTGAIGWMIFNNPEKRNAVSLEMWEAAARILDDFKRAAEVRVVVLKGAGGKAFVSGADISRFESERANEEAAARYSEIVERAWGTLYEYNKPTIAMIEGYCIGGGVGLAVCCDMRICSQGSRFGIPAARLGLGYGYSGVKRLVDLVGPAFAKEIFLTARQFTADEAYQMGLVNRVLPDWELEGFIKNYAATIAENAPLTMQGAKLAVGEVLKDKADRNLSAVEEIVRKCFASADYKEGRTAFLEKRKPSFRGE